MNFCSWMSSAKRRVVDGTGLGVPGGAKLQNEVVGLCAKTTLELACPNIVSCADILTTAIHDFLTVLGGPHFPVFLGRRDSSSSSVDGHLPKFSMPISQITQILAQCGFSVKEMFALSGAHTVEFSHCFEFTSEICSNTSSSSYNPRFAQGLQKTCADYSNNPTLSVFNDIMKPNKFDNVCFQNLPKGLGVLKSDHGLFSDPSTRAFVESFAKCWVDVWEVATGIEVAGGAGEPDELFPMSKTKEEVWRGVPIWRSTLHHQRFQAQFIVIFTKSLRSVSL